MSAILCELRPFGHGETIQLTKDRVLIGSHRLCDITIHSADVAPVSCQLFVRGSSWYIRDLGETTKVNGLTVTEERLVPGDVLWIGTSHKYEVNYDPDKLERDP